MVQIALRFDYRGLVKSTLRHVFLSITLKFKYSDLQRRPSLPNGLLDECKPYKDSGKVYIFTLRSTIPPPPPLNYLWRVRDINVVEVSCSFLPHSFFTACSFIHEINVPESEMFHVANIVLHLAIRPESLRIGFRNILMTFELWVGFRTYLEFIRSNTCSSY